MTPVARCSSGHPGKFYSPQGDSTWYLCAVSTNPCEAGMAPRKIKKPSQTALLLFIILGLCLLFWLIYFSFEDRHWKKFSEAGTRALERGNYEWAEKMYGEALQYAQAQGPDNPRVVETFLLLHRLYKVQGRNELAEQMLARARELRAEKSD